MVGVNAAGEAVEPGAEIFFGFGIWVGLSEGGEFFGFEFVDVLNGEHGDGMFDLGEALKGFATDALGGGIRGSELWVFRFESFESAVEAVVFLVGEFGGGFDVV